MNKQELIERMKGFKKNFGNKVEYIELDTAIELISRLDAPGKVTVPQFVADWIDNMKGQGETLYYGLDHTPPQEVDLWFCEDEINRQNIFARAWLDGYEVEKEKRYLVKMKGLQATNYLNRETINGTWYMGNIVDLEPFTSRHTRKELEEDGFGWVFDCSGIEIEEVE